MSQIYLCCWFTITSGCEGIITGCSQNMCSEKFCSKHSKHHHLEITETKTKMCEFCETKRAIINGRCELHGNGAKFKVFK